MLFFTSPFNLWSYEFLLSLAKCIVNILHLYFGPQYCPEMLENWILSLSLCLFWCMTKDLKITLTTHILRIFYLGLNSLSILYFLLLWKKAFSVLQFFCTRDMNRSVYHVLCRFYCHDYYCFLLLQFSWFYIMLCFSYDFFKSLFLLDSL